MSRCRIFRAASAAQDQITWVLTSYIVAAAIMTPLTGWLAGAFGIKRVFLISVAGFTVASALCGLADSLAQMVLFRLLQGVCGAALMPLSQAVLLRINPPERHGQAMAVWGTGAMVGPIAGPALLEALFVENSQIVHSRLVEHLRPDNPLAHPPYLMAPYSLNTSTGIAALNAEVTRQAQMVAYIDDFKLMMVIALLAAPLLLLLRKPRVARTTVPVATE
jgi:MFS family permease